MTQFKDRRLLTTLLKESILQLCKISVGLVGDYEIDGLICISSSESDDQHIVVKVHEQIVKDGYANVAKRTSYSPDLHSDGEQGMSPEPRTNAREEMNWGASAINNHKRWMDNGAHERKHGRRHVDPCRAQVHRGDSESPDQHGCEDTSSSNAHATRLRNSFYIDTRTASSASFPADLGIGHCSYSIAGDRRRSRPLMEFGGISRKRVSSCDVDVGDNKRRIRCSSDDVRAVSESSLGQAYDDSEDVKHAIATVGVSEVYEYNEVVNVKKEVDSLDDHEARLCFPTGQSSTAHSVIMTTHSAADYDVRASSQEVDSATPVVSSNGLIERDAQMTGCASLDAESGSPGEMVDNALRASTGAMGESTTYSCSLCNGCFPSERDMATHFTEGHTCSMTFCCDRCHRGFSDEQAYKVHTCSNEHVILSDNANSGNCKHVSMSDDVEGCQYPNDHEHVQQTVNDPFVSDADKNALPTVLSELSFGTSMQTDELHCAKLHRDDLYPATDKSFVDTLIGEIDYSRANHHDADTNSDYRCIVCQMLCDSYAALEAHSLQEHKRYTCPHCNKSFTQTSSRNRHMHTHGCRKPFACLHCSARFTRADTLRRHYTREHRSTEMPAWLRMPVRNDAVVPLDRTLSLDAVTLQSAWPTSSPVDVNNDAVVAHTYLTTVLRENVRTKADMIEISDDGE